MRKPYQSPGPDEKLTLSYYIAPVGDRTHDLPHTVASNMVKVSHALNYSAKRVDSTNQKRLPPNAHAHRDVFQACLP